MTEINLDSFKTSFPAEFLAGVQKGVMQTRYRTVPFFKSPFDIVLYIQLIGKLQPRSVIEIGTKVGGSALWFADMLQLHGISPRIVSVDREDQPRLSDSRILFIRGNVLDLTAALPEELLKELPRPWLVVEDSVHSYRACMAALAFFTDRLVPGEYLVIEDGIVAELPPDIYARYEDGPNRAVHDFLFANPERLRIDRELCDFYGRNVTYNPNAWLCRI